MLMQMPLAMLVAIQALGPVLSTPECGAVCKINHVFTRDSMPRPRIDGKGMKHLQGYLLSRNISLRGGQSQASSPVLTPRSRSPSRRSKEQAGKLEARDADSKRVLQARRQALDTSFAPERDVSNVEVLAKLVEAGSGNISITNFTVLARLSDTIRNMKHQVERITGLPPTHQRIISRGKVLTDQDQLRDHPSLHNKQNPLHIIPIPKKPFEAKGPGSTTCDASAAAALPAHGALSAAPVTWNSLPPPANSSFASSKSLEDTLREAEVLMGGPEGMECEAGVGDAGLGESDSAEDSYYDKQAAWLTSGSAPFAMLCMVGLPCREGRRNEGAQCSSLVWSSRD